MVETTFISDGELNKPTGDPIIDEILNDVREATKEDFQIITRSRYVRCGFLWLRKKKLTSYRLCMYVGGVGPWQIITIADDQKSIVAYLYGIFNGYRMKERHVG